MDMDCKQSPVGISKNSCMIQVKITSQQRMDKFPNVSTFFLSESIINSAIMVVSFCTLVCEVGPYYITS